MTPAIKDKAEDTGVDQHAQKAARDFEAVVCALSGTVAFDSAAARQAIGGYIAQLAARDGPPLYLATTRGEPVFMTDGFNALAAALCAPDEQPWSADRLPSALRGVIAEVRMSRESVSYDETIRIDGVDRRFHARHFPLCDSAGKIVAVGGAFVELVPAKTKPPASALADSARKFNDFARAASDWFWETDAEGNILMLSDRVTDLLGRPAVFYAGKRLEQVGDFIADDTGRIPVHDAMAATRPFREQSFEMITAKGEPRMFMLSGVPVFGEGGDFAGYRGAGRDITRRVLAEREALESRRQLERTLEELTNKNVELDLATAQAEAALNSKGDFLASMSHELRTPLNAIIGFAEAMSMQMFGEINQKYVEVSRDIVSAGRHLLDLINDVLDVSVLDSGALSLETAPLQVAELVEETMKMVALRAEEKKLNISRCVYSGAARVLADERRARQILMNLLSNAVKFTPERGRVGVDVSAKGDQVAITVWDSGVGIPADRLEKVFEKFHQVTDDVYSRQQEGTGLGLYISRNLARMMGGDLTVESTPGKGSRFTLSLPRAKES